MRTRYTRQTAGPYGQMTLDKAVAGCRDVYDPDRGNEPSAAGDGGEPVVGGTATPSSVAAQVLVPTFLSVADLCRGHPQLKRPVIHGLLRETEVMNVIAPPKFHKSYAVLAMAIAVATGRCFLDTFPTQAGPVLVVDNELHPETLADRLPTVAAAAGAMLSDLEGRLFVEPLRGRLRDVYQLGSYFAALAPGQFKVVVLDAFYRLLPRETDENSNADLAAIYNQLDRYADQTQKRVRAGRHASKGVQAGKSVTDVGAGAGSQSRAADAHLILRQHEADGAVVLDAAVRSWPPPSPLCLRWDYPLWRPAPDLDPTMLRQEGRRKRRDEPATPAEAVPAKPEWTTESFVAACVGPDPRTEAHVLMLADTHKLSERKAKRFLQVALDGGLVHRWVPRSRKDPHRFATVEQPVIEMDTAAAATGVRS